MMENYRNQHKNKRSKLDFIYAIVKNCQEPRTPKSILVLSEIRQADFYELFEICIDKFLIEKTDLNKIDKSHKKNYVYYKATNKGLDFIILYDKMVVYIEKMNLILK
jgi:predicted transcriptional regulator